MKTKRKIPKTFISFLITSFLIWVLITFSKEYSTTITYPVVYKNIPLNKLLQEEPIKEIDVTIKATGFKILRTKARREPIQIQASKLNRNGKSSFYILPKNQFSKIEAQLLSGIDLVDIVQDTIFLNIGILTSKKVALKPNLDINYHIGYDLLNDILISPDSIIISGPESQINKVSYLNLEKLTLKDVKSNFEKSVKILKPKNRENLKFGITTVMISGNVDKFTEGKLEIPFSVRNLPSNVNLTTLADNIEVSFVVALSNFAKVSEASFKVECDYAVSERNNLGYLIPRLVLQPDFIKSYKMMPSKIDFLIQK